MSTCGFPIIDETNRPLANCNDRAGHDGLCSWLLSRDSDKPGPPETLAEGILRRVGEMDAEHRRTLSALRDLQGDIDRMRCALLTVLEKGNFLGIRENTGEAWIMDIARLGLGLPTKDPVAKLP